MIKFKPGTRYSVSAETMYNEIEATKVDGDLTPSDLVDRSQPKDAPLHGEFTWSDKLAGEKWRIAEAKQMVRSIVVVREDAPTTRAYESVKVEAVDAEANEPREVNVYRSVEDILADPIQRDELLARAIADIVSWRKRYAALQELSQIIATIDSEMLKMSA